MPKNHVPDDTGLLPDTKDFHRAVSDLKKGIESSTWATTAAAAGYSDNAVKWVAELTAFNKDTLTAFTVANQICVAGCQDLFHQGADAGQAAFAESLSGFRGFASIRTVQDGIALQASLARASLRWMSESIQLAQAGVDLAHKVSAPLTERASVAVEKLTVHAASVIKQPPAAAN